MAHRLSGLGAGVLAGAVTTMLFASALFARQPSAGDIANSLAPKTSLTRGPSVARPSTAQDQQFLDGLKNKTARSITVEERNQVAEVAKDKPAVDLEINFDYASAIIGAQAMDVRTKRAT